MEPCDDDRRPEPCALVLFGATGDLTRRKLVPALYSLFAQGHLPERFAILAYARRAGDDGSFRQDLREALQEFAPRAAGSQAKWDQFAANVHYVRGELGDPAGYRALGKRLSEVERARSLPGNRLYYMAVPPDHFGQVAQQIGQAGLAKTAGGAWIRLIVEKPFGYDLATARELNDTLHAAFDESQIYRIDHYLGKETVQNLLVLRFANSLFELLWNRHYVDNVQVTVAETLGMEGRGAYFDRSGIVRDIVQNHGLQILSLVAMEPPVSLDADAVRDEKVKVLRSIRPFDPARDRVRGQYAAGRVGQDEVPGYTSEEGVPPNSRTSTFAAIRVWIDNWRWAGVPFYLRAGKRLPRRVSEVVVQLRSVPAVLFARLECSHVAPNRLIVRIQPDEGAEILLSAKEPGPGMQVSPVGMHFEYAEAFGKRIPDAYERLIVNAMLGDPSLFARSDEVEAAWSLVGPLLAARDTAEAPELYPAGTWGPRAAEALPEADGRAWWNL